MNELLPKYYSDYGKYINQYRSFPFLYDGLKMVERRLLYTLYLVAKDKFVKSANVVGHCMAHFHPHGDSSIYMSLVSLVNNDLAVGQGNWGSSYGVSENPAAAYRYTEVKASKTIINDMFEFIDRVPYKELELESEPLFLPTKFPVCLLNTKFICMGMGFGYKTTIPNFKHEDLLKRLEWILDKTKPEPIIKPITDCINLSTDKEFKDLLKTGSTKLDYKGVYKVIDNTTLIITSIPSTKTFEGIFKKFNQEFTIDKSLGWQDESKNSTKVKLKILKPRSLDMKTLCDKLDKIITGSVSFQCNVCNKEGKVQLVGIDDMLFTTYQVYMKINEIDLKFKIDEIDKNINEYNLMNLIKPLLSNELKTNPNNIDLTVENISKSLNVDKDIILNLLNKYTIARIFKLTFDIVDLQKKKEILSKNLLNIKHYVWNSKYLGKV